MFRFNDIIPVFQVSQSESKCATVIDNFDSQDFNINDAGWVRNDISQLMRAQSKAEFDMLMSRLSILPEGKSIPDDMTLDEAIKSIKPRWCQSPNELEIFAQMTHDDYMARVNEAYEKSLKDTHFENETPAPSPQPTD